MSNIIKTQDLRRNSSLSQVKAAEEELGKSLLATIAKIKELGAIPVIKASKDEATAKLWDKPRLLALSMVSPQFREIVANIVFDCLCHFFVFFRVGTREQAIEDATRSQAVFMSNKASSFTLSSFIHCLNQIIAKDGIFSDFDTSYMSPSKLFDALEKYKSWLSNVVAEEERKKELQKQREAKTIAYTFEQAPNEVKGNIQKLIEDLDLKLKDQKKQAEISRKAIEQTPKAIFERLLVQKYYKDYQNPPEQRRKAFIDAVSTKFEQYQKEPSYLAAYDATLETITQELTAKAHSDCASWGLVMTDRDAQRIKDTARQQALITMKWEFLNKQYLIEIENLKND